MTTQVAAPLSNTFGGVPSTTSELFEDPDSPNPVETDLCALKQDDTDVAPVAVDQVAPVAVDQVEQDAVDQEASDLHAAWLLQREWNGLRPSPQPNGCWTRLTADDDTEVEVLLHYNTFSLEHNAQRVQSEGWVHPVNGKLYRAKQWSGKYRVEANTHADGVHADEEGRSRGGGILRPIIRRRRVSRR